MNQCKMRTIQNMAEIVIVIVYLGRRKLSLIYDILGGQGTDVEAFCERTLYSKKSGTCVERRTKSKYKQKSTNMRWVACFRRTYS